MPRAAARALYCRDCIGTVPCYPVRTMFGARMRPIPSALAAALAAALPIACQQKPLWDDQAFDRLTAPDAGTVFETDEAPPEPPPAQASVSPWGDGARDMAFLIGYALQHNPGTRATWERAKATAAQWAMVESLWWPRMSAFEIGRAHV